MATPVVFVHGLWLHSTSWQGWVEKFNAAGYESSAPEWPGTPDTVEAARAEPAAAAGYGVKQVTEHYARVIDALPSKPILIGHSFGGLIVQKLLGDGHGIAGVALDPAPMKGVLPLPASALKVAFGVLKNPANRNRSVSLTAAQFRYGFGNAVDETESTELHQRWAIPSPGRPLFEAAFANLSPGDATKVRTDNSTRGPLLLVSGGRDHTVPPVLVSTARKRYRKSPAVTDYIVFADRGHSIPIDHGWAEVADACLDWLAKSGR